MLNTERIYIFTLDGNTFAWTTNPDEINKFFEDFRKNNGNAFSYETKIDLVATYYNFKLNK